MNKSHLSVGRSCIALSLIMLALIMPLTACTTKLIMEPVKMQIEMQGPSIEYEGVFISDELLARVKPNETGSDWLLAVFGTPTRQATLKDGSEIWQWSYKPLMERAALVSVLGGGKKDEPTLQPATAFVRIVNGIVVEKWRD